MGGGLTPLQRYFWCILQSQPTRLQLTRGDIIIILILIIIVIMIMMMFLCNFVYT